MVFQEPDLGQTEKRGRGSGEEHCKQKGLVKPAGSSDSTRSAFLLNHEVLQIRLRGTRCGFASCPHGAEGGRDLSSLGRPHVWQLGVAQLSQAGSPIKSRRSRLGTITVPFMKTNHLAGSNRTIFQTSGIYKDKTGLLRGV